MSQKDLESSSGVSATQISRLESGGQRNPQIETVVALATSLGVSIEEIVFGEKNPNEINYLMTAVDKMSSDEKEFIKRLLRACVISHQAKILEET